MSGIRQFVAISLTLLFLFASPLSLASPKQLTITGSSTWQPFSYINREGKPDGIMIDYWRLYGAINDVDITFKLLPWSESLTYAATHPGVVHGGLGYTGERAKVLAFSRELPLQRYNVNLFVQKDLPFDDLKVLDSVIVGSVSQSAKHAFLSARIPEKNIKIFSTFGALNEAAYRGEIDVFIDDLNTALYDMRHTGNMGLFTPRGKLYSFPLHFAVSKSAQENIAIIEHGLHRIDEQDVQKIYDKWMPPNKMHLALPWLDKHSQHLIFASAMLLLITGLIFYRRLLNNRTEQLRAMVEALKDSNERLENAVQNDMLTGAKTRHQFFTQLADKRFSPTPYVVAVVDIDMLKHINESYGQDIGDMALKHLSMHLRLQMSSRALYARLGGGQFAVLFDLSDNSQATRKIQQLQNALQLSPLHIDQLVVPVKVSAGVACYPYDSEDGESLVRIATSRMRANKPNYGFASDSESDVRESGLKRHWA
ncbi:transporter substrate-binding domain-containing diguanylate cyclase [Enterovibrio norvegicus]|uniref:diguanylate cyclase n=2 Tax=Enterovibrio norvegicus TaxID=188144 RepID=A0A1I5UAP9_9GAMM|nr:GGDEF domain-containing protein [Enterovibrio norvegicus]OEF59471.1 ABC transporter substrate-binding protein [Enterovibrio norvegicus]SFP92298.1 diguanylate cyclase (GGDEF) domain-containing protein [Enterovibrio norvegicus DSM 15893]